MTLDPKKTACLSLDIQAGILAFIPGGETILPNAVKAVNHARRSGALIVHVGLGFRDGYPEAPATSPFGGLLRQRNMFIKGTPSAEFHPDLVQPKDLFVHKQRVSGFSHNELQTILRANGIENLILFGIATSGIVLSTLRQAFDLDYKCTVIKDACLDRDPEVHRVLTEKVFANQAAVMTADEFIA